MIRFSRIAPFIAVVVAMSSVFPAYAEGPGTGGRKVVINDQVAGPYRIRVITSPTPPRVENLYVEVRVLDDISGDTITDAEVQVIAELTEGEALPVESEALHDIAPIPTEYAAHLPVSSPGVWRVTVSVEGQGGRGQVSFLTRVGGANSIGPLLSVGLPFAGLAALIALFLWLQREESGVEG